MAVQVIASAYTDGPTLTAATTSSMVPTYVPTSIPAGYWQIGRIWRITAAGRLSNVVTTPGTARMTISQDEKDVRPMNFGLLTIA